MRPKLKHLRWLLLASATLTLLLAGGWWYLHTLLNQQHSVVDRTITIPPGRGANHIITQLAAAGVIQHPQLLKIYIRINRAGNHIQSGSYHFTGTTDDLSALQKLIEGRVVERKITIPEGLRSAEIIPLLAKESGISIARWQQAWQQLAITEGELLPESWRYTPPLQPRTLLHRMVIAQQKLLSTLEADQSRWQQLRTIASIIEKESALDSERPIISAVIHNRLRMNMPLQMDPTIIYGLYQLDGSFSGDITRRDLKRDTPWNSYLHRGLPPTPICHPGRASLIAAAHPSSSQALYFVANGNGGHSFATTLAEHRRNVAHLLRLQR
ncbi:MAG: endolytic transglycosylase MltG [Mariprofundales bacterium]|nr:endolytic transglycosylase MltG [Mariprofundales bacterium]